jgi:tetratricopeptide (TPR) repeat protein
MKRLALTMLIPAVLGAQDAAGWYREGLRQFAERQPRPAIESLQRSVRIDPKNAAAWKALGVVFASLGEIENAATPFRNACEQAPSLEDACLYYGRTLYLLDRFQPAMEVLRRALKTRESGEGHRLLALSLEAEGKPAEAEAEFRSAARLSSRGPADEDPAIDYGVFLFRQGRVQAAVEPLQTAVARHPDSSRARLELGCVLLGLDRLQEAVQELERSLAIRETPRAHMLLGKAYLRMDKPEAAEPHLNKVK